MPPPAPITATGNSTLVDLCEPVFQYLCRLNRAARAALGAPRNTGVTAFFTKSAGGGLAPRGPTLHVNYASVRTEIVSLLNQMQKRAAGDFRLSEQVRQIDLPLKFFIDSYIAESKLPFAAEWNENRLAYEQNELAGDEKLFDVIEETLRDRSSEATERLAVYYVFLGLGFTGPFGKQIELLRKTMNDIAPRIQHLLETDRLSHICPDAYQGVDGTNLIEPESNRLVLVVLLFVCFSVAAVVAFVFLYSQASNALNNALDNVKKHDPQANSTTR